MKRDSLLKDVELNDKLLRHNHDTEAALVQALRDKFERISDETMKMERQVPVDKISIKTEDSIATSVRKSLGSAKNEHNDENEVKKRDYSKASKSIQEVLRRRDSMLSCHSKGSNIDIQDIRNSMAAGTNSRRTSVLSRKSKKMSRTSEHRRKSIALYLQGKERESFQPDNAFYEQDLETDGGGEEEDLKLARASIITERKVKKQKKSKWKRIKGFFSAFHKIKK